MNVLSCVSSGRSALAASFVVPFRVCSVRLRIAIALRPAVMSTTNRLDHAQRNSTGGFHTLAQSGRPRDRLGKTKTRHKVDP